MIIAAIVGIVSAAAGAVGAFASAAVSAAGAAVSAVASAFSVLAGSVSKIASSAAEFFTAHMASSPVVVEAVEGTLAPGTQIVATAELIQLGAIEAGSVNLSGTAAVIFGASIGASANHARDGSSSAGQIAASPSTWSFIGNLSKGTIRAFQDHRETAMVMKNIAIEKPVSPIIRGAVTLVGGVTIYTAGYSIVEPLGRIGPDLSIKDAQKISIARSVSGEAKIGAGAGTAAIIGGWNLPAAGTIFFIAAAATAIDRFISWVEEKYLNSQGIKSHG